MARGEFSKRIRATALAGSIFFFGLSAVQASTNPPPTLTFPQIVTGTGISLELNLANPGARLETGVVLFKDNEGDELELLVEGEAAPTSRLEFSIKPGGARKILFRPQPPGQGYALVVSDSLKSSLVGNVIFTIVGLFDVSISDSPATTRGPLFVERNGGAVHSGVGLLNPGL